LLEAMSEAVYVVDPSRMITYWNLAAEELTGYRSADVLGRRCSDAILNHVDGDGRKLCQSSCPLAASILDGQARQEAVFLHHRSGHRVPVAVRTGAVRGPGGEITGGLEVFHDDTTRRRLVEHLCEVESQALTDELTGVANRRMLGRVLRQCHDDYLRYGHSYAVLFADIDRFKAFNERYGHDIGDRVLRLVAATLEGCARGGDSVGRWGGEEFLIVAKVPNRQSASRMASRLRRMVASTWTEHEGLRLKVSLTIGVAFTRPRELPGELVRRADAAMFAAKKRGSARDAVA
jgi:diguanylate cyclase (GGDEF)-like protein/PAS domain S-box-containing protein